MLGLLKFQEQVDVEDLFFKALMGSHVFSPNILLSLLLGVDMFGFRAREGSPMLWTNLNPVVRLSGSFVRLREAMDSCIQVSMGCGDFPLLFGMRQIEVGSLPLECSCE